MLGAGDWVNLEDMETKPLSTIPTEPSSQGKQEPGQANADVSISVGRPSETTSGPALPRQEVRRQRHLQRLWQWSQTQTSAALTRE